MPPRMTLARSRRVLAKSGQPSGGTAGRELVVSPTDWSTAISLATAEPLPLLGALLQATPATRARVVAGLQRTHGNAYVQRLIQPSRASALSPIVESPGAPGDLIDERADASGPATQDDSLASITREGAPAIARQVGTTAAVSGATVAAPTGPLTDQQVKEARRWYAAHRDRYTPEIITRIQQEVGTDPTGIVDTAMIQGVAKYQQANPPLWVDGIAGPRTMPAVFPVGLAQGKDEQQYVKEAKQVQTDWAKLATASERARALAKAVNERLAAAGVPACKEVVKDLGHDAGQFDFTTWSLLLGQGPFSKATITDAEAADMADTVYHEARHCEQWFMMARMLAGKGLKAGVIATTMGIPAAIASAAAANPLKKGTTEAIEAEGWYESVYGSRAEYRERVLNDVEAKGQLRDQAAAAYKKNPTPANRAKLDAAQAEFEVAHRRYMELPEEADAWRVGGQVTAAYLAANKLPP